MAAKEQGEKLLHFKGKPLVRNGNTIYYGSMEDEYVALLQVMDTSDFKDLQMPRKVSVQIVSTDSDLRPKERIKKRTDKETLYEALNIASIWLHRMLEE